MSAPFAIGFDFDHTLGLDHGLEVLAFNRLAEELGRTFEPDVVARELARFRSGALSLPSMVAAIAGDGQTERWQGIALSLVDRVTPIAGATELLAELDARGIPVAILTNGWSPLQEAKIARAVGFTGTILVSEAIGVRKPDPAAFSLLVGVLGLPPERCWYVGDSPEADIAGALGAGLSAVWFDWESVTYPAELPPPTARVTSLDELLAIVPGHGASAQNVASQS